MSIEQTLSETVKELIPESAQQQLNKVRQKIQNSAEHFERRNRVSEITIILMLAVASFYDGAQFLLNYIPFVGTAFASFVGIWAWLTFYTWTSIKGWGSTDTLKKWIVTYAIPFIGIAPIANWGPEITIGVFLSIAIVKSDDFVYNKTKGRVDGEIIKEGLKFFNVFRDVYNV